MARSIDTTPHKIIEELENHIKEMDERYDVAEKKLKEMTITCDQILTEKKYLKLTLGKIKDLLPH